MQLFQTRIDMARSLVSPGGVYAEIGVFEGTFSKQLQTVLSPTSLYLIDLFTGRCDSGDQDGNNVVHRDLPLEYAKMQEYVKAHPNIHVLKGRSAEILASFPDNTFDMIYIDGDHSYQGCLQDLRVAFSKVKPDGWILGHDYEMNMMKARTRYTFGVRQAVDEFCASYGQTISAKGLDGCVSFGIQLRK